MPNVTAGTAPLYGGTVGQLTSTTSQVYVATSAAWVNATAVNGTADYLIQPGLVVQGTADAVLLAVPSAFTQLNVTKGP